MTAQLRMRQYQEQAVASASPEQLVAQVYGIGITACHRGDREKVRAVLHELIRGLNFQEGGELATQLHELYAYCQTAAATGDLGTVAELLSGLRDAWCDGVLTRRAA